MERLQTPAPRLLTSVLARAAKGTPVRIVTGARQTGKSTLVRFPEILADRPYVTLDDIDVLERAQEAPDELLRQAPRMVIDEVQRAPRLLVAVKRAVDGMREPGRFVLTGSANLLLMKEVSESLAGRASYFTLWPLTRRESLGLGRAGTWTLFFESAPPAWVDRMSREDELPADWTTLARRGGFPTPALEIDDEEDRDRWFAGYARTYLERDLRDVATVASIVDFRRLMRAACLRLGSLANLSEISRDIGMPVATVHRQMNVLEVSYLLVRLSAYAVNRTKRLIKAPKLYWADTGLALHVAGETSPRGAHLENLVLLDLLAWQGAEASPPEVHYWRTASGDEVDFVLEWKGRLLPVEVKAATKPRLDDAKGLRSFRREYGKKSLPGLLLHGGAETFWMAEDVLAAPWWRVV